MPARRAISFVRVASNPFSANAFVERGGRSGDETLASAMFSLNLESPGYYHVYATWPNAANASPVQYIVHFGDDMETRTVMQNGYGGTDLSTRNCNTWTLLGAYQFRAGPGQHVLLRVPGDVRRVDMDGNGQVYADAILVTTSPLHGAQNVMPIDADVEGGAGGQ